ncbi:EIF4E2 [Symbiodinium necroappetens]|uniref:EIF4E2 protein n=1 Tax=Symbiodinium necroappetens TaxID=1628268 RepID=A0A812K7F1_9DINO|nr:EIF4E2 [Symbiodinium necroappetens]
MYFARERFAFDDDLLFGRPNSDYDSDGDLFLPRRRSLFPRFPQADSFISLQVADCYFTQETVACRFRHGSNAGAFLSDVIVEVRAGVIHPSDMGLTVFEHAGRYYTFNNRTLYVLKHAGVNVVRAKLWNRPNNYHSRICFGKNAAMR